MAGIDRMIASSLSSEIKKNLDSDILKKVERELFLQHGMSIKLSIEHFEKFSSILRKNSSIDVNKFEKSHIIDTFISAKTVFWRKLNLNR